MQRGAQVTDERQVFAACPNCDGRVEGHTVDLPEHHPYCSRACKVQDLGLRRCSLCRKDKDAVTFQPVKPGGEVACEECASVCSACGVQQSDPQMLDEQGECTFCEATRLAKAAVEADPYNPRAKRLLELIEDLAPEVRRESA